MKAVIVADAHVADPDALTTPNHRIGEVLRGTPCWSCLFSVDPPLYGGAKFALRLTGLERGPGIKINWPTLSEFMCCASRAPARDVLRSGDRVVVAIGPMGLTPLCTIYEIRR